MALSDFIKYFRQLARHKDPVRENLAYAQWLLDNGATVVSRCEVALDRTKKILHHYPLLPGKQVNYGETQDKLQESLHRFRQAGNELSITTRDIKDKIPVPTYKLIAHISLFESCAFQYQYNASLLLHKAMYESTGLAATKETGTPLDREKAREQLRSADADLFTLQRPYGAIFDQRAQRFNETLAGYEAICGAPGFGG